MKSRSYYALILLLSCVAPITVIARDGQEHRARAGSVIEATSVQQLNDIIANNARVVVDFYSPTCPPCKRMAPEYAKLPASFSDIVFVKIDVGLSGVTSTFGIRSMPTLYSYLNGEKVNVTYGFQPINDLINYVKKSFNI